MKNFPRQKMTIKERLDKVERQNRQLKRSMIFLALVFLALVLIGAKAGLQEGNFSQVTAERITIVDDEGRELIQIGSDKERTGIRMLSKAGKRVLGLGYSTPDGESGILVADNDGRPRIGLGMDGNVPGVALVNENGKKILAMGGDERGYGLTIFDDKEVQRASIGYKYGYTGVIILDDQGQYVRGMIRDSNGSHYFSHVNSKGDEIIDR